MDMSGLVNQLVNDIIIYKGTNSKLLIDSSEKLLEVVGSTNHYIRQFAVVNLMIGKFDCGKFKEVLNLVDQYEEEIAAGTYLNIKLQFYTVVGITYKYTLNEYSALISFQNALHYGKVINDQMGVGAVYCNMADVYRRLGDYDNARAIYERGSYLLYHSKKSKNNIRFNPDACNIFLCKIELAEHNTEIAMCHLEKIKDYNLAHNNEWKLSYEDCLFQYYLCIEDYSSADAHIRQIIANDDLTADIYLRFQNYYAILKYIVEKNKTEFFEKVKNTLYTIIREMDILEYNHVVYELIIDFYTVNHMEDCEEMLDLYHEYERLSFQLSKKQKDEQGKHISGYMKIIEEIDEIEQLRRAGKENKRRANEDYMTGLLNRRGIDALFKKSFRHIKYAKEYAAIGMVDVDYFKRYNDHYGHLQGDEVLKKVAEILKARLQSNGFVGRYGGDEFIFCVYKAEDLKGRLDLIMEDLEKEKIRHFKSQVSNYVTITLGVIMFQMKEQKEYQYWINKADLILLEQKEVARGRYKIETHGTKEE